MLHVAAQGFYEFTDFWKTCVKFDSSVRMAVPLFFMLSGYLLFNGKTTLNLGQFLKRRLSRILLPFFSILVIYLIVRWQEWSVGEWFNRCFNNGQIEYHLWFMYALVGLYLAVPLFERLFTNNEGLTIVRFYVGIWLAGSVFYEYAKRYFGWNINPFYLFNCHYFFGFMGFFFLGGLFRRFTVTVRWRWCLLAICILSSWCIYRLTKFYSFKVGHPDETFFENLSPFVVLQAVSFFLAIKDISFSSKFLSFLAQHTYWMYLGHVLILNKFQHITELWINVHTAWRITVVSIATFVIAFILAIPFYRTEQYIVSKLHLR